VFSALLLAAVSVATPAMPAASITTGAVIATCFAPEENCNAFAVDAVNGAEREILVSAYSLTTGSGIPEALARTAQRGVDVRVIADRTTPCGRNTGVDLIVRAGARSGSTGACGSLTPKPWSLTARSRWSAR
jgi:phosphatidylserine/phosphatidylglycerophosphate/cardiolipin synthase-like enzyme